jgi:hypothetical protein
VRSNGSIPGVIVHGGEGVAVASGDVGVGVSSAAVAVWVGALGCVAVAAGCVAVAPACVAVGAEGAVAVAVGSGLADGVGRGVPSLELQAAANNNANTPHLPTYRPIRPPCARSVL